MTKDELLRTAMRSFSANGVKEVTERRLMQEFGLSVEEFNQSFTDKEDFLRQAVELYLAEQKELQNAFLNEADNPLQKLMQVIRQHVNQLQQFNPSFFIQIQYLYPRIWTLYLRHAQMHSYYLFHDLLNQGIRQQLFRPDLNIEVVTKVLLELINILMNHALFPPHRYNLSEVFRGIFLYYLQGISTEKGNKVLENFFSTFSLSA
ncbi:TetR/AcrR family transcriptional regulator [Rufibacter latericius]|uniref:TetR/AcrR family transcriptional regulator n=1 Tax=Rufibacter latericius TaxID=2487040 RepID=A0A3M9MQN5_9BACT|nr:TetR/AcrR family transcriptional regulator [Rufibacter latericius]RNI27018.1 TetR/AcrR family transcriptional regulator [Rufibacter latericius]